MDNIMDVIRSRRSIRKYLDKPIPKEIIDKLIEAAKWAPTGMNEQHGGLLL
jgi:nitroreductase